MSVDERDVRHVAALARLGLDPSRTAALAQELNGILAHMEVLRAVDTTGIAPMAGPPGASRLLRSDEPSADPLRCPLDAFAPSSRDGFFLVPRLAAHEGTDA
ncbi:MAG: Asp-tRNA(Asn)/Glu-tRNA(Gln) amidotransferase subunit GatC [Gemmatimonadaceae bacterium]|nr:Asp-tRNA(Asn)/Glu-tRNA(Gln) amidotransferase subunit GatC [Gemmatimonadaceae bacterium]